MAKDKIVSTARAAEMLGVTDSRIRHLLAAGRLRGKCIMGRCWLVSVRSVVAYRRTRRQRRASDNGA